MKKYHIVKLFATACLTGIIALYAYLVYFAKTTDVDALHAVISQETIVYDRDGQEAGSLSMDKGTFVTLDQISPNVVDAVLSTEDKRFYKHHGVDPIGIMRAFVGVVTHFGKIVGGGSTITQQLAKNGFLTQDQTIMRKLKEFFLSFEIENRYTKDQILEMYLNKAYYGNGAYGIQNAAQKYFAKSASELTVSEAAILAGSLKAPSYYNPIDQFDATVQRRATVLQLMVDNKKLSDDEAQAIASEAIIVSNTPINDENYRYPYYFDAVIDEVVNQYGISEQDLLDKGYKIYTGLNQEMQASMQQTYSNSWLFPLSDDGTKAQSASVAIEPTTGDVLALVGGRIDNSNHTFRGYNRSTQMKTQPASTFKPLAVYTLALEEGYTPSSLLVDEKRSYGSDQYTPENYNKTYQGKVTMTEAIQKSWNAPAVWLLNQIGLEKGIDKAKEFGIPVQEDDHYLGFALGGLTKGVSPVQMASAYTAFANKGIRAKERLVTRIIDASGKTIVDNTSPSTNRVTSEKVAKDMTSMMLNVYQPGGTGAYAAPGNYTIAGKTGTTEGVNPDNTGVTNHWMIAYTPDIVVATWMGYDDSKENLELSVRNGIAPLFQQEMLGLLAETPGTPFGVNASNTQAQSGIGSSLQSAFEENKETAKKWLDRAQDAGKELYDQAKDKFNEWKNRLQP